MIGNVNVAKHIKRHKARQAHCLKIQKNFENFSDTGS